MGKSGLEIKLKNKNKHQINNNAQILDLEVHPFMELSQLKTNRIFNNQEH